MWTCSNCGSDVRSNIAACWNCGYAEDGSPPSDTGTFAAALEDARTSRNSAPGAIDWSLMLVLRIYGVVYSVASVVIGLIVVVNAMIDGLDLISALLAMCVVVFQAGFIFVLCFIIAQIADDTKAIRAAQK